MCDTLTREIIAQKNHGNWLILTVIWVSENAATSAHVSPYMSRKTFSGWGFAQDPDWGAHIAPRPLLFWGRGGEEKGRGRRGRGGRGGKGRGNLCSCKFSLKYALSAGEDLVILC